MTAPTLIASRPSGKLFELTLPPGTYYVGDPCYALASDLYGWLSDQIFPPGDKGGYDVLDVHVSVPLPDGGAAELFDMRTKHGDGRYPFHGPAVTAHTVGRPGLGVDSGGMAVIDARLVTVPHAWSDGGRVVTDAPLRLRVEGGDLHAEDAFSVLTEDHNDE